MNLKQLSDQLGLSQTTVSRALNDYPEVNEKTRSRVKHAASIGGYHPDVRAIGLATGKARVIGHVIPVANKNDVFNPVFTDFIAAASQTYSEFGYELMLKIARSEDETAIYKGLAAARAVDGVVLHSPLRDDPRLALLQEVGLPFVVHGRVLSSDDYSWVDMDNENAFKLATQHLIDLGHTDIALLNGLETLSFAWLRKCGYLDALNENNIAPDARLMASDDLTEQYGFQAANSMLAQEQPPTAFLVSSYIVALGVRRAISLSGLAIGKDISVIIHDDELSYFDNGGVVPQFTSTRSSVRDAGRRVAELLLQKIKDPDACAKNHLMDTQLTIGASTGPCRRL